MGQNQNWCRPLIIAVGQRVAGDQTLVAFVSAGLLIESEFHPVLKCCSGRVRLEILRRIVGVQEVLVDNAFSSCEFTTVRFNSKYLLTETLTFCSGQLIVSTADSHSDD